MEEMQGTEPQSIAQSEASFLEIRGLAKQFGGVHALKGVDLSVRAGEVHGLVGANGAGKSTLIRLLAGIMQPDGGEISLDGRPVVIRDAQHAMSLGLSFIHQELNLIPKFTALQNLTLGLKKPTRLGLVDWSALRREVEPVIEQMGIHFSLDNRAEDLTVAQQWLLSIGRALVRKARLIAMDEPTASLSPEEVDHLFKVVRELTRNGIAVIYVTHRLHEVELLCNRVTVFKDGERVALLDRASLSRERLVEAIVGREQRRSAQRRESSVTPETILEVRNLARGSRVREVSFRLMKGEILGLAGLAGAGRTELVRLLFGADRAESGEIHIAGGAVRIGTPHDAIRHGIGLVPEERRSQGLMLAKSIAFNMSMTDLGALRPVSWLPFVSLRRAARRAEEMIGRLLIKMRTTAALVQELSGGTQQKVVIGKWLLRTPRVLIMDEPTRGVDIGARAEIYDIIHDLAHQGTGVLVVSSDVEELVQLCDRIVVMVEGRISGELSGAHITEESVLRLSYKHGKG